MQHKYNQILNQKQKQTVDWIKDTESRINNIENRKQLDHETKILSIIEDMIHSKKNLNQNRLEIQKQISSLKHNTNEKNKVLMLLEELVKVQIALVKKKNHHSIKYNCQMIKIKSQTRLLLNFNIKLQIKKQKTNNQIIKQVNKTNKSLTAIHIKKSKTSSNSRIQKKQVQQKLKHQLIKKKQLEDQLKLKEAVSAQNILSLHKQLNQFRQSHNQLSQQNEDLKIEIQKQKKQLQRISTKLRHEYQLKLDNLSKQNILQNNKRI